MGIQQGQMIAAQFENSASDLTPTSTGLVYFNTSTAFIKYYNGAAWKSVVDSDSIQTIINKTLGTLNAAGGDLVINIQDTEFQIYDSVGTARIIRFNADLPANNTTVIYKASAGVTGGATNNLTIVDTSTAQSISGKTQFSCFTIDAYPYGLIRWYDLVNNRAIGFRAPAAVTVDTTFTWPNGDGSAAQVLSTNGSAIMSWVTRATPALDNLASVAINTSLVSDTNNTDDLGTSGIGWREGFINKISMDSNGQTTSIQGSASASATVTYSLPPADGSAGQVLSTNGSQVLSWISNGTSKAATDWLNATGTSKTFTHNLNTTDLSSILVFDTGGGLPYEVVEMDTISIVDANNITLTVAVAPAISWRIVVGA